MEEQKILTTEEIESMLSSASANIEDVKPSDEKEVKTNTKYKRTGMLYKNDVQYNRKMRREVIKIRNTKPIKIIRGRRFMGEVEIPKSCKDPFKYYKQRMVTTIEDLQAQSDARINLFENKFNVKDKSIDKT